VTISPEQLVRDTVDLVRIDSQNPGPLEMRCASWLEERLGRAGFAVERQQVSGERHNLVVRLGGGETRAQGRFGAKPRLVLLAHMDTVPVGEGWSRPPLEGTIEDGRIVGRGSADMKGGLAVAISLLESLRQRPAALPFEVLLCATVDEEAPGMEGAHLLVGEGVVCEGDQVLALEPTGLRLRLRQMGLRWLALTIRGRMAHAGRAHLGVDANQAMARVVVALHEQVEALPHRDPVLGRPLFTCGVLSGGHATNVVAGSCRAQLDVRLVPPMTVEGATELVRATTEHVLADFPGSSFELEPLGAPRPPVAASESSHLVKTLGRAFAEVTGSQVESGGADGHEAYTDASMVAALTGSDSCTVFGPGSSDQAHTADEWVTIGDLVTAATVLEEMVSLW
jgi:succinyl-diaminopimelate desuccinylase